MALLLFANSLPSLSLPSSSSSTSAPSSHPFFKLCKSSITLQTRSFYGSRIHAPIVLKNRSAVIVKASSDIDGVESSASEPPIVTSSDVKVESVSIENLPLESKVKVRTEQQIRMRIVKKLRLKRKWLVRKRHLRKKGRWPPSKMKKNKNV